MADFALETSKIDSPMHQNGPDHNLVIGDDLDNDSGTHVLTLPL